MVYVAQIFSAMAILFLGQDERILDLKSPTRQAPETGKLWAMQ
jgi:hypothetical protein